MRMAMLWSIGGEYLGIPMRFNRVSMSDARGIVAGELVAGATVDVLVTLVAAVDGESVDHAATLGVVDGATLIVNNPD